MNKQLLVTLLTFLVIVLAAGGAVLLAKGYRVSTQDRTLVGTGILSINSTPDQASVYLDGHLTTATNANVNSLEPKSYVVRIVKDGLIPWEKEVWVKQGLVTEIKATLFPAIPTIYPLTFNGVKALTLSSDSQRAAFIVLGEDQSLSAQKKNGIWVWDMTDRPVAFGRGREPHQVLTSGNGLDLKDAKLQWSADSNQILLSIPNRELLLDANKLNDDPRDITPVLKPTLQGWENDLKLANTSKLQSTIKDITLRQTASASAMLKWSPDDTKLLYCDPCTNNKRSIKVTDLELRKTYELPPAYSYSWLGDSRHLVLTEVAEPEELKDGQASPNLLPGTISVIEYDGGNKSIVYAGQFDPESVFSWPDSSRVVMVSSMPTPTASTPNLFGVNLR